MQPKAAINKLKASLRLIITYKGLGSGVRDKIQFLGLNDQRTP